MKLVISQCCSSFSLSSGAAQQTGDLRNDKNTFLYAPTNSVFSIHYTTLHLPTCILAKKVKLFTHNYFQVQTAQYSLSSKVGLIIRQRLYGYKNCCTWNNFNESNLLMLYTLKVKDLPTEIKTHTRRVRTTSRALYSIRMILHNEAYNFNNFSLNTTRTSLWP